MLPSPHIEVAKAKPASKLPAPPVEEANTKPAAKPLGAAALHARGRQLSQDGKFAEAIETFTEALKLDPSMPLAYNARGYAHFRLKHYPEAIADFDQAIKLNPAYANAYLNRSAAKRASGDKAGADADQIGRAHV